eukprot:1223981-Alexandrium_andersonii.AAC.1
MFEYGIVSIPHWSDRPVRVYNALLAGRVLDADPMPALTMGVDVDVESDGELAQPQLQLHNGLGAHAVDGDAAGELDLEAELEMLLDQENLGQEVADDAASDSDVSVP